MLWRKTDYQWFPVTLNRGANRHSACQHTLQRQASVFLTAKINVTALVQDEQCKPCKHNKSNNYFPHFNFPFKKKASVT